MISTSGFEFPRICVWPSMKRFENPGSKIIAAVLLCGIMIGAHGSVVGWGALAPDSPKSVFRVALSASIIEGDVNANDALAAVTVWARSLGNATGLYRDSVATLYNDLKTLKKDIDNKEIDFAALGTLEYIEAEKELRVEPSLAYVQSGQLELEYLVIVRGDGPFSTLSSLRGGRIAIPRGGRHVLAPIWVDVMLMEHGFPGRESFFRETRDVQRATQAILPVFFRQIEAAVITRSAFETATTLNPQIGQSLKVLASSPGFVPLVMCTRTSWEAPEKKSYVEHALRLHETPVGLQTFHVFKVDRLVPWQPHFADSARELLRKHKQLTARESDARRIKTQ